MHQKLFFRAPNANISLPWEGDTPSHTLPRSVALLPRARSLIIMMNVSKTVIFAPNMHQKLFFGLQMQIFPALGGGQPQLVASLPRSSPRRLLSETWKYRSFPEALARFAHSLIIMMNVSETACLMLMFFRYIVVYNYYSAIPCPDPPPLGRFAPSHIEI